MKNLKKMIEVNSYFDDNVKSLGYETPEGKSTVGVMEPGDYEFGTSTHETMIVIEGEMHVTLPGETEAKVIKNGEIFQVDADQKFKVSVVEQTSYLCQYS